MKKLLNLIKAVAVIGIMLCVLIAAWYGAILIAILVAGFIAYHLITYADELEDLL